jgi:hypothetical protein
MAANTVKRSHLKLEWRKSGGSYGFIGEKNRECYDPAVLSSKCHHPESLPL